MAEMKLKSNLSKAAKNSRKSRSRRKFNFKADDGANQLTTPAKKNLIILNVFEYFSYFSATVNQIIFFEILVKPNLTEAATAHFH